MPDGKLWCAALLVLLLGSGPAEGADASVSYSVQVVTTKGALFTGLVPKTEEMDRLLDGGDSLDPTQVDPGRLLTLAGVNGLNGSLTLRFGELKSLKVEQKVSEDDLKERQKSQIVLKASRLRQEAERLKKIAEQRAAGAATAKERQERLAQEKKVRLPQDLQQWIDRFPPDAGWIPSKKARLYYQTVILNNRTPTDEERAWLDSYEQWKVAYDAWLELEKAKLADEEAAKQAIEKGEDVDLPTGESRSDRSGTAASGEAGVDPDNPTKEAAAKLPPAIDPQAPQPEKISEDVKKPVPLDKNATKPEPLKDGTRP
ncbi:MAG: hypothetical protein V2A76_06465 [Planctomycetota bacterium]